MSLQGHGVRCHARAAWAGHEGDHRLAEGAVDQVLLAPQVQNVRQSHSLVTISSGFRRLPFRTSRPLSGAGPA